MPQRLRLAAEAGEQLAQVVVRVGEAGVEGDGAAVVGGGFAVAVEVLERQGEVVVGDRIDLVALQRQVVAARGGARVAGLVRHAAEVDVGVGEIRVELEGALVGGARRFGIIVLEADARGRTSRRPILPSAGARLARPRARARRRASGGSARRW